MGLAASACGHPADSRPPDLPGTLQTATRLTLGASATLGKDRTPAKACLNPDGLCVPGAYGIAECFRYEDIAVEIAGVPIPRTDVGGWTANPIFPPAPTGGNGYGCTYPAFEIDDLGVPAGSNTQEITVRVGGETATATVADWLIHRTLSVPDTFVPGSDIFVGVEPAVSVKEQLGRPGTGFARPSSYFTYDESELDEEWCRAKYDLVLPSTCISASIDDIAPEAWGDGGYTLLVPTIMPAGVGTFGFGEGGVSVETPICPFAACDVTVGRSTEVPGIVIGE